MQSTAQEMRSVDLKKMCLDWYQQEIDSNSYPEFHFNKIKIKVVRDVSWTNNIPVAQAQRGPVRKATVKFNRRMEDILSDLEISKESETVADITLTDGVVKGLGERSIKLKPPASVGEAFASNFKVQLGQIRTVIKKPNPTAHQTSECTPPMRGATATATITSKESSYKGRFQITLSLEGEVIFATGDQQNIGEIIRLVQKGEREPFFSQTSKGQTYWTVTGEVELRWDEPDTIQWSINS